MPEEGKMREQTYISELKWRKDSVGGWGMEEI